MKIQYFCDSPTVDQWISHVRECRFQLPSSFIEVAKVGSADCYFLGDKLTTVQGSLNQWRIILDRGVVIAERFNTFDGRKFSRTLHDLSRLRSQAAAQFDHFMTNFGEALEVDGEVLLHSGELVVVRQTERELFYKLRPFEQARSRLNHHALLAWGVEDTEKQIHLLSGRARISKRNGMTQKIDSIAFAGIFILLPAVFALARHEEPARVARTAFYSMMDCVLPFPVSSFIDQAGKGEENIPSGFT